MDRPREEVLQSVAEKPTAEAQHAHPRAYPQSAQYPPSQNQAQQMQQIYTQSTAPSSTPPNMQPPVQLPIRQTDQYSDTAPVTISQPSAVPQPQISHEATQPETVQRIPQEPITPTKQTHHEARPELTSTQEAPGALVGQDSSESQSSAQTVIPAGRTSEEQKSPRQL